MNFEHDLENKAKVAYPDGEYNSTLEQLVINQFILGLANTDMEKHVQFAHPQTLEAAIACAIEYEAFTKAQNTPRKPREDENPFSIRAVNKDIKIEKDIKFNKTTENSQNLEMSELIKNFSECVDKMTNKLDKIEQSKHSQFEKGKTQNSKRGNFKYTLVCWRCQKVGHKARFCKTPNEELKSEPKKKDKTSDDKTEEKNE